MNEDLKAKLLAPRCDTAHGFPEREVELPGLGTVRVRGLSRAEHARASNTDNPSYAERRAIATALIDPVMTEQEVATWQRRSPAGELAPVVLAIMELSGATPQAPKEAYKSLRDGAGAGVRVFPGAEAVDDGGGPADEDAG